MISRLPIIKLDTVASATRSSREDVELLATGDNDHIALEANAYYKDLEKNNPYFYALIKEAVRHVPEESQEQFEDVIWSVINIIETQLEADEMNEAWNGQS